MTMRGYGNTNWSSNHKLYRRCLRERDVGTLDVLSEPDRGQLRKRARQASSNAIASELDMVAEEVELDVLDAYEYDEKEFDREMVKEFRRHLASATEARAAMPPPDPPPRYDDVFFEGVEWLNDQ